MMARPSSADLALTQTLQPAMILPKQMKLQSISISCFERNHKHNQQSSEQRKFKLDEVAGEKLSGYGGHSTNSHGASVSRCSTAE